MANSDPCPWVELLDGFRCLWDPQDRGFDDENQRVQAYEQLLEQCKQRASSINMVTLKLWVASVHRYKTGRKTMGVCTECIAKSKDLAELLPEFPCLWDFRDLNFSDNTVKDHCIKQFLRKYNDISIQKINMETLFAKLNVFNQNRMECFRAKTCKVMLTRERLDPDVALSNQQLLDTRVQTVDPVLPSSEQLFETYADTSYPIHRELEGEPMPGQQYRESQDSTEVLAELLKDYPILWDPRDLNYLDNNLKASAREHLLERYNAICSVPMDMAGLKRKLNSLRRSMTSNGTQKSAERMAEMIEEFPCLSDPRNTDWEERKRARVQLLAKYNAVSSIPINMNKLIQKIHSYIRRRNKLSKRLDQATTRLQRSEDSQCSQTNSHSTDASINGPQEPSDEFQHIDYEMDSDVEYNSDDDYKDIKDDPISITDTEFVKQSVNMCVKETGEGKRVYVYLDGCLSLTHNDRKNDNEIESDRSDLATNSDNLTDNKNPKIDSGIDIVDLSSSSEDDDGFDNTINIIYDSLRETELDVATKGDIPKENESAVYVIHSEDTELDGGIERESDTKCMGTFSETIEGNELLYSVVLPNIFRCNSE